MSSSNNPSLIALFLFLLAISRSLRLMASSTVSLSSSIALSHCSSLNPSSYLTRFFSLILVNSLLSFSKCFEISSVNTLGNSSFSINLDLRLTSLSFRSSSIAANNAFSSSLRAKISFNSSSSKELSSSLTASVADAVIKLINIASCSSGVDLLSNLPA
ncbi:conserved hypothetical protein [Candida tropicalis MYA-3404]|uniref:Uncharacterized protein n=1 Tax=Candida tropicalis (strain ATCC MYA-3404 / T1) TaxID=294747 RepID=C5MAB7_CANTT|nr:conserved hypothetical protein [Candida tropicalis MYA-3404]EER33610.1 conserved hypothetical protein [Candida tropicalis MYA-3404]KAG4407453.1 hypothetical protein JTP64_002988 [Candida tropicalis]